MMRASQAMDLMTLNKLGAVLVLAASATAAQSREVPSPRPVPPTAITPSTLDLRNLGPREVRETADSLFVVRNDCSDLDADVHIDEYPKATLKARQPVIVHCKRFAGNIITAIGADENDIYIKFGFDDEVSTDFSARGTDNLLVVDRRTRKEVTLGRTTAWIDLLDASGPDIVGCNCIGTIADMPTFECVTAEKGRASIRFAKSNLDAHLACLGGSNAIAATRIPDFRVSTAINEKFGIQSFSNAPTAVYPVESPMRKLDITLPPQGYEVAGLGTGATSQLAALYKLDDRTITVATQSIPDSELTELVELPASAGKNTLPRIHLYSEWLVAASDDAIFIRQTTTPNRSFLFKTEDHSWILSADVYGHVLYVRHVPAGAASNHELPAVQIDLDLLPEK